MTLNTLDWTSNGNNHTTRKLKIGKIYNKIQHGYIGFRPEVGPLNQLRGSGDSKNFEKGAEDNLSAPSSFIANAHNEIYAFYTEKRLFDKKYELIGGVAALTDPPPFESATAQGYSSTEATTMRHRQPPAQTSRGLVTEWLSWIKNVE